MLIQWCELYPNYSTIMIHKKNFDTSIIDNKKELKSLIAKNIAPYICFHNRDDGYLKKIGNDGNDHGFRNFDFSDYNSSINFINSKNIKAVRVGRITNNKYKNLHNSNYFDFTNKKSSDYVDVLLINNSEFLVASATGLSNIAAILRKKILLVNVIPFWLREMYQYTKGSIFLPKKIYCLTNKKFLKFSEVESLDYNIHENNFFEKRNLSVINNTEDEISSSVKEMLENYKDDNFKNYEKSQLHTKFWNSIVDKKAAKIIRNKLKINISDAFLKKNKSLI
jgi:putative glycosyltransferase (TIGR04372 family)